jgi:hypothetical protein
MSGTLRSLVADFDSAEGTYTPPNLFAGEAPIITTNYTLTASTAISAGQVLAIDPATGYLVVVVPAATDGTEIARCIAVEAVASNASAISIPVYVGGFFNHAALTWPAAWDTLAERKAAFEGTDIHIGAIPAVRS